MQPDPLEIEDEVLEDELIEAALLRIERNELKSELIALEETLDECSEPAQEENLNQTNTNESTNIDWF